MLTRKNALESLRQTYVYEYKDCVLQLKENKVSVVSKLLVPWVSSLTLVFAYTRATKITFDFRLSNHHHCDIRTVQTK